MSISGSGLFITDIGYNINIFHQIYSFFLNECECKYQAVDSYSQSAIYTNAGIFSNSLDAHPAFMDEVLESCWKFSCNGKKSDCTHPQSRPIKLHFVEAGFILAKLKQHLQTLKVRSSTQHLAWGVILIIPLLEEKQCYISLSAEQTYYQQLLPGFCCGLSIQKREVIYPSEKRSFPEPRCFMWMTGISSFLCRE